MFTLLMEYLVVMRKKIKSSVIKNLVITDTIDNSEKLKVLKTLRFCQFQA